MAGNAPSRRPEHHLISQLSRARSRWDYPLAVAVDTAGRPDKLGQERARLAAAASHVLVFYHGLDRIPERFSGQAQTDLYAVQRAAEGGHRRLPMGLTRHNHVRLFRDGTDPFQR